MCPSFRAGFPELKDVDPIIQIILLFLEDMGLIGIIELLLNNRTKVFGHGFSRINTDYTKIKEKSVSEAAKSVFIRVPFLIAQQV
jgi:hypothetical protein